jgi:hypothetical protein
MHVIQTMRIVSASTREFAIPITRTLRHVMGFGIRV